MTAFQDLSTGLDYPMVIVTLAGTDGERSGCLVGFHTQCSVKPPRWLVCISKKNHTYAVALGAGRLAVHFPPVDDAGRKLASLFGEQTGDDVDKFSQCSWRPGEDGVTPVLDGIDRYFVGRILERFDLGDHTAFVIDPSDAQFEEGKQLGFQDVRDYQPGHPL